MPSKCPAAARSRASSRGGWARCRARALERGGERGARWKKSARRSRFAEGDAAVLDGDGGVSRQRSDPKLRSIRGGIGAQSRGPRGVGRSSAGEAGDREGADAVEQGEVL